MDWIAFFVTFISVLILCGSMYLIGYVCQYLVDKKGVNPGILAVIFLALLTATIVGGRDKLKDCKEIISTK